MSVFKGIRTKNGAFVTYNDAPLDLRLDLKNYSPMGFEWGYNGSGARQLALAMLSKLINDKSVLENYEEFSKKFIETIQENEWNLDDVLIIEWIKKNNIICTKPLLTPRFKIHNNFIFLDNQKLGEHLNFSNEYNIEFEKVTTAYCNFSEISSLKMNELPNDIVFEFTDPIGNNDTESEISENFTLHSIKKDDKLLIVEIWYKLNIEKFQGELNPLYLFDKFEKKLSEFYNCKIDPRRDIDDGYLFSEFTLYFKDGVNSLDSIINYSINEILNYHTNIFSSAKENYFEAIFDFPEEYQSILKPYMLYFEEFLNDLCIESDVSIRKEGLDTILSVEPKNKDEALEKIADALKMYITAPILASDVTIDEKLQMQTALQKLHAQCTHLESQLLLKTATLNEQTKIFDETKRVLIEAGIAPKEITANNTMLIDSLKEVRLNQEKIEQKTFLNSFKVSFKVPMLFKTSIEINREQLKKDK